MDTWRKLILEEMKVHNETMDDIIFSTLTKQQMNIEFNSGYGGTNGIGFTIWTKNRVYFPCCYDGAEWAESVSRNPDGKPTEHIGGG